MSKFDDILHNQAMDIAERAFSAKEAKEYQKAKELFKEAFELEKKVAMLIFDELELEPSRSVTFQSAATLAYNAGLNHEAEKMAAAGLAGDPPGLIASELRELYDMINFSRHLEVKGVELNEEEYQFVISGPAVGHGIAKTEEFTKRLGTMEKMAIRTADRLNKVPYKDKGRPSAESRNKYSLYLSSTLRAASLAATIRVGNPLSTKKLFPEVDSENRIIDEIISNLSLLNENKEEELKNKIGDDAYFRNFVGLSKELAPDGENIKMVGITAFRKGKQKDVAFSRSKKELKKRDKATSEVEQATDSKGMIEIKGTLYFADASKKKVKLTTDDNKSWTVKVPEGLSDIVKPYWEEYVSVYGKKTGKTTITLEDIDKVD